MPRKPMPWFRVYVEITSDRKIRRLKPDQRWLWVALLAFARRGEGDGRLMVADDIPATIDDLADDASMTTQATRKGIEAMVKLGMLDYDEATETWTVARFNDRQFDSDNVTARTAKHRGKERSTEQRRNVPTSAEGTDQRQRQNQRQNQSKNPPNPQTDSSPGLGLVPLPDASPTASPVRQADFDAFWERYPRKVGKPKAQAAYRQARKRSTVDEILTGLDRHLPAWRRLDRMGNGDKIPHPTTWLNRDGWGDDPPPTPTSGRPNRPAENRAKIAASLARMGGGS